MAGRRSAAARSFRPTLHKAEAKLKGLRTAEGPAFPSGTMTTVATVLGFRFAGDQRQLPPAAP